jgi:hypothetical protein
MLLIALAPLPYGYYTILRIVVCGSSAYISWTTADTKITGWTVAFAAVALLFNPIVPVYLDREIWAFIDVGVAVIYFIHWWISRRPLTST